MLRNVGIKAVLQYDAGIVCVAVEVNVLYVTHVQSIYISSYQSYNACVETIPHLSKMASTSSSEDDLAIVLAAAIIHRRRKRKRRP